MPNKYCHDVRSCSIILVKLERFGQCDSTGNLEPALFTTKKKLIESVTRDPFLLNSDPKFLHSPGTKGIIPSPLNL